MSDINELSEREREILHLVATGASNKEIATELYISSNTVKVHLRNIFTKIGVSSRTEAAMYAVSAGLVEPVSTRSENGFTVLQADGDLKGSLASETLSWYGWLQIFVSIPWLILILVGALLALGLTGIFLISQNQPETFASNGPAAVPSLPRWRQRAVLPTARSGLAVAAYEDHIYAIGGESGEGISGLLERYDPSSDQWTKLLPKPIPVADIGAVVIGGLIYVPGGRLASGKPTDKLEVYDPREDQWQLRASLPMPLSAYALAAFEGKLYLFGGWDGDEYVSDALEYDPDRDIWLNRTNMPSPRGFAGAAVAGGKVYVIGGYDGERALSVNEEYVPEADSQSDEPWTQRAPLPGGRYAMGVASVADIVHVFGGTGIGTGQAPALEYLPGEDDWQQIESPEDYLGSHLGTVLLGTRIYALGGFAGENPSAKNIEYQALYTLNIPVAP